MEGDEDSDPTVGIVCIPDTFGIAGVRRNENSSFIGGNTAAAAGVALLSPSASVVVEPVAPGTVATLPSELGTALASAPPGRTVGADEGIPAMPGNENISFPVGSEGATAIGETFPPPNMSGCEVGVCVAVVAVGAPGTSAVALPNDAAIARRSASDSGPGCAAAGEPDGIEGEPATGVSCNGSISENIVVGISSDSISSGTADAAPLSPFARSFGITRKNSLASRSSNAGSGKGIEAKGCNFVPSPATDADFGALDLGLLAPFPLPLLVFVVFVDMDVLQHAEGVFGQDRNGAVKRDQVGSHRPVIDAHETHRQAGRNFSRDSRLE